MDSKKKSLTEGIANVIPGFLIAYAATFVILPPFSVQIDAGDPIALAVIAGLFTGISLTRMFVMRRLFERLGENENLCTLLMRIPKKIRKK